jgi:hypothetical protein
MHDAGEKKIIAMLDLEYAQFYCSWVREAVSDNQTTNQVR